MKKKLLVVFSLLFPFCIIGPWTAAGDLDIIPPINITNITISGLFPDSELPNPDVLQTALSGYRILLDEHLLSHPGLITIIDFSLPSNRERLWVIDLIGAKVLYHCLVSHGSNSGDVMAGYFSNHPGSFASSPGFYSTGESYFGKNGLSLALNGLEKGINDKARERDIVIHGADYVSNDFIRKYGRLGRSHGCPVVPEEINKDIIDTIKSGTCLFIYPLSEIYLLNSPIINKITTVNK